MTIAQLEEQYEAAVERSNAWFLEEDWYGAELWHYQAVELRELVEARRAGQVH